MGKAARLARRKKSAPPAGVVDVRRLRAVVQAARVATAAGRHDVVDQQLALLPPAARHAARVELARTPAERITPEQETALRELWARIPAVECRGKCWDSCGAIQMTDPEHALTARGGFEIADSSYDGSGSLCPALTVLNTCAVYDDRPTICRLFGAAENMQCSQGCRPVDGQPFLRVRDAYRLLAEALRIAGDDQAADEILADFATDELADAEEARIRARQAEYDQAVREHKAAAKASGPVLYAHGRGRVSSKPAPGMIQ